MFESTEYRVFPAAPDALTSALPNVVAQISSAGLVPVAPAAWSGKTMAKTYGMATVISVRATQAQGGTGIELTVGAEIDTTGIIVLVLLLVFFWPAALIVGWLGYDDFTKRRAYMMQMVWHQLAGVAGVQPSAYGVGAAPGARPPGGFGGNYGGYGGGYG